ncbi:acylphosphatase [Streptodolium elevatio]
MAGQGKGESHGVDDAALHQDGPIRDDGTRRVRVVVSGRVQGVFFRATCATEADDAGVSGWVRNRADGRVEAVFEGRPAAVAQMVAWMRHGPPEARVDAVAVTEEPAAEPVARGPGFVVLR